MSTDAATPATPTFSDLGLPGSLLQALTAVGYETPSPIQAATIPPLLAGRDVLGQAQTGTGKTAAFALPALARIDPAQRKPQVLVLAPTRELAIQVAEAFQKYAAHLPGFQVLPIYGGQGYAPQLSALKRGVQVIVGTPGRVIDHLNRGSLDLSELRCLVLDEADEMLRMGFIDDVEAVLKKTPETRQVALFSATMPQQIRRIAQTYLKDPVEIAIKATTTTAANIRQRYWMVSGTNKLDALTRILEAEPFDGMLVFARTKLGTQELAEKLAARGLSAAAIHGDVEQKQREKMVQSLKDGRIDILVATDVAARGLDVDRISHVLNYDIPYDTESYVHRIGRTGRAGRSGEAILFVAPRERGMLGAIERATRQKIEPMQLPSVAMVNDQRVARFLGRIGEALESDADLAMYRGLVERYESEHNVPMVEIAAALAKMVQGDTPLLLVAPPERAQYERPQHERSQGPRPPRDDSYAPRGREQAPRHERAPHSAAGGEPGAASFDRAPRPPRDAPDVGMETFRIEVGHSHGVQPGNIVGAIANEADLESRYIGRIDIRDDYSLVDLPQGMPHELMEHLKKVYVGGQPLKIRRAEPADSAGGNAGRPGKRPFSPRPPGDRPRPAGARGPRPPFPPRTPHRKGPPRGEG
ncbi:DEAD/DEAH box helicase [Luteimonas sp. MC1572]|uniref:DEAD/DEAH box helicase n=1 Tax=Luteimonas sp. MC1572 TaxID=2799325 RepID=UPI0018F06B54|nr:DEAD/DEAH box helicase [Luteimonas sp. MC1572]MBJ6980793.1 DEAD/DEAH box helicase [Luteimonas sp. MC1572]QQO02158.1 DEAD/DEAH box helicase [Luteimonas sp. MC1572]